MSAIWPSRLTTDLSSIRRHWLNLRLSITLIALFSALWPAPAFGQSESVEYYGTDALGSIRVVYDVVGGSPSGGRADYLPFGEELSANNAFPSERFTGQARDAEAGSDYLNARMYKPGTGRFSSIDAVFGGRLNPQKWNRYSYAINRPVVLSDKSGNDPSYDCYKPAAQASGCVYMPTDAMVQLGIHAEGEQAMFGRLSAEMQEGESRYNAGVQGEYDAQHAMALVGAGDQADYVSFRTSHPELALEERVNPNYHFGSAQEETLAYLKAAGIEVASVTASVHDGGSRIQFENAVAALATLNGGFDRGRLGGMHRDEVGANTDYRSAAFGPRVLQVVVGKNGVYADTDLFNPYNPVGFVAHGIFEVGLHITR